MTHWRLLPIACAWAALGMTVSACGRSQSTSSAGPHARSPSGAPFPTQTQLPTTPGESDESNERAGPTPESATSARPATPQLDTAPYPWHADSTLDVLEAVDPLEARFAPPPGFSRVAVEPGSFGAWLRRLPLAAADSPVLSYRGSILLPAGHRNVAAVATLDIGQADLQQCADAVIRLHAEWAWSRGRRDMSYRAAAGTPLPYARWARGERVVLRGSSLVWQPSGRKSDDHASFRRYLDAVFSWANTVSLARQARTVGLDDMRPGDFMILPGNPGHSVLILDLARSDDGRRVVLLGQSYMPAQSFHVLRPSRSQTWFTVDPDSAGIQTPFWPAPFPWSSLRRLD